MAKGESFMSGDAPENWLPVVGWEEHYMVSDLGNIRSFHKGGRPRLHGDCLAPSPSALSSEGRLTVALYRKGERKTVYVHRLVLEAFVGPCPEGCEALHGPGGPLSNCLGNLSWGSRSQNQGPDRLRDGTSLRGRSRRAKFSDAIVLECRHRYAAGETQLALAAEFGIKPSSMSAVITGAHYASLPGAVTGLEDSHKARGGAHPGAKLTAAIVLECRARNANGESMYDLAEEFGVKQPAMHAAIRGRNWKHI
jgi:hypothetical protein